MDASVMAVLLPLGGFALGAAIGLAFGMTQRSAFRRHTNLEHRVGLRSGWALVPGSFQRTALFLIALGLVQVVFPILFEGNTLQWVVSAGIILGYGWTLVQRLRAREVS